MTKQSSWEGSLPLNVMSLSGFDSVKTRLLLSSVASSQIRHVLQCSLHFAIVNSNYWNIILEPKEVKCLVGIHNLQYIQEGIVLGYWQQVTGSQSFSTFYWVFSSTNSTLDQHPLLL